MTLRPYPLAGPPFPPSAHTLLVNRASQQSHSVVLSSHEGRGLRKRLCPRKLKAGWSERHSESPQRPTSPGDDGHRDRALERRAGRPQMEGQTHRNQRGSARGKACQPTFLSTCRIRHLLHTPVPTSRSCLSPLTCTKAPVPSHPLPQLCPQQPEGPCQILSPLPLLLCSEPPLWLLPPSHTCRPSLMQLPCPKQCFLRALKQLPRLAWNS